MTKTVTITIKPTGEKIIKTSGYVGEECLNASKLFENSGVVVNDEPTDEMYLAEEVQTEEITNDGDG